MDTSTVNFDQAPKVDLDVLKNVDDSYILDINSKK